MKALVFLLTISGSALANDASLLRCREISDIAGRVACYDAIPVAAITGAEPAAPPKQPAAVATSSAADNFGLSIAQLRKPEESNTLESNLIGKIDAWGPNTQFHLANGQVWRVVDGSSGYVDEIENPKVTITRNGLGTMFLDLPGARQPPRVRRVQ
jgi:hypothetical protein